MKTTTATYKSILASKGARHYLLKIDLELASGTTLHLTGADIWEDSFSIDTASSGTSSFDIGTAVIGQCKFTLNNINGDFDNYDFFNAEATVWLGLEGDVTGSPATQQYYRMGFYTVDEPSKANGLISLTLLDNMWKLDVPFSDVNFSYSSSTKARDIVLAMCSHCGITLSTQYFNGYNFPLTEEPDNTDEINCREMLQYIAMIGCNFCYMDDTGALNIKWYNTSATSSTTVNFDLNQNSVFGTEEIEITGVKFTIGDTDYTIGSAGYRLELQNPLVNANNVSSVLNSIWNVLSGFTLHTFNITTASDLSAEIGDKCQIKDYKGNYTYSWITTNNFKLAGQLVQCNAQPPNRTLVKRYSQSVKAAVEVAREQTYQLITNYDQSVQRLNKLVEQSMGAYTEYEESPNGGRIYYISNMPITKSSSGTCSFETGSTVYRMAGDVFSVSVDGGQTWRNGYDPSTGELIVNVLSAIGINFDWARGGTLTLGGYGNGNGVLSIQNASNVEKVHGDNTGLKIGGTTGSKIHITTDGHFDYYYDNTYCGNMTMEAHNYGTQADPDIKDSLTVQEFDAIRLETDDDKCEIDMHNTAYQSNDYGYLKLTARSIVDSYDLNDDDDVDALMSGNIDYHGSLNLVSNHVDIGTSGGINNFYGANVFRGAALFDDPIYIDNAIYVKESGEYREGLWNWIATKSGNESRTYQVDHGLILETNNNAEPVYDFWHEVNGNILIAILGVGSTSVTFNNLESPGGGGEYSFEPHIKCASGVDAPVITSMSQSGSSLTVNFTAVTSAQAGSGNECQMKLRVIV